MSATSLLTIRFFVAGTVLITVCHLFKIPKIEKKDLKSMIVIGVFGYFVSMTAQMLGTQYGGASLASLVNSMNPITIMIFAALILKEKINFKKILGILFTVMGSFIIILHSLGEISGIMGIFFSLVAVLSWSLISIQIKIVTRRNHPLRISAYGMLIAAICSTPFSAKELFSGNIQWSGELILTVTYISIFCTAAAYAMWNQALTVLDASICSSFYPLQPLVSSILGILILREQLTIWLVMGGLLIAMGVLIININLKRSAYHYDATD